jgi:hypothetical protein
MARSFRRSWRSLAETEESEEEEDEDEEEYNTVEGDIL